MHSLFYFAKNRGRANQRLSATVLTLLLIKSTLIMVRSPFPLIRIIRIIPAEGLRRRVLYKALPCTLPSGDSSGKWESNCTAEELSVSVRGHVWCHLTVWESQGCKSIKTQSGRRIWLYPWAVLQLAGANKQANEWGGRCCVWWGMDYPWVFHSGCRYSGASCGGCQSS